MENQTNNPKEKKEARLPVVMIEPSKRKKLEDVASQYAYLNLSDLIRFGVDYILENHTQLFSK